MTLSWEINPEIWISCACGPDLANTPTTIYQNCRDWVANGWMDEVFSMSYSAGLNYPIENGQLFMRAIGDDAFYSVGLSAFGTTERDVLLAQTERLLPRRLQRRQLLLVGQPLPARGGI